MLRPFFNKIKHIKTKNEDYDFFLFVVPLFPSLRPFFLQWKNSPPPPRSKRGPFTISFLPQINGNHPSSRLGPPSKIQLASILLFLQEIKVVLLNMSLSCSRKATVEREFSRLLCTSLKVLEVLTSRSLTARLHSPSLLPRYL